MVTLAGIFEVPDNDPTLRRDIDSLIMFVFSLSFIIRVLCRVSISSLSSAGLEILAFPCNQFGEEEPGTNNQIVEFVCTRFKSEFPIFEKIEVNGNNASPLYKFLKSGKWGIFGDDIQWNFAKFLVNRDGKVVDRYYPTTSPLSLEHDIKKLLGIS